MWQIVARITIGILLIIHGFANGQSTTGWRANTPISSWLLPNMETAALSSLGTILWVTTLLTFVASGFIVFTGVEWWRPVAVASSVLLLLVIGIFWQPNIVAGAVVDVGVLIALLWVQWSTPQLLGT